MDRAELARAVFEEGWNRQDFARVGEALTSVRLHVGGLDRQLDLDALRAVVAGWHEAFSDFRFDVHTVLASADDAAVRATLHGTNDGPWRGAPATGRTVAVEHMFFLRFEGHAVVDVWEVLDRDAFDVDVSGG